MSVNKAILIGHVGQSPKVSTTASGKTVANFSLATSETYKAKDGQRVTNTEWHKIVVWDKLAELVEEYVSKGSQLYVEGKIKTREYEDKEGNKRYITEIYCDNLKFLGTKKDGAAEPKKQQEAKEPIHDPVFDGSNEGDGLPF